MLLNLSAITLTCFVTRELKSCQDLVILPALNTDGRDPGKSATPKKMLSASTAQQVALIGSCTYPSLVNLSLWWLKDCPRKPGISHPALPITYIRDERRCYQSDWMSTRPINLTTSLWNTVVASMFLNHFSHSFFLFYIKISTGWGVNTLALVLDTQR